MSVLIGMSGWDNAHWAGVDYPQGLPRRSYLGYAAGIFDSLEINGAFYRLPAAQTLTRWRDETPTDFIFAFKASRFLTHMKKVKDPQEPLARMLERARVLGAKLGPVLFQLPPRWKVNPGRLDALLHLLPPDVAAASEFRDPSWFCDDVYAALERHRAAFCLYDMGGTSVVESRVQVRVSHAPTGIHLGRTG